MPSVTQQEVGWESQDPALPHMEGWLLNYLHSLCRESLSQEINRVKQEIRENINNLRQQNELLLSGRSH